MNLLNNRAYDKLPGLRDYIKADQKSEMKIFSSTFD